MGVLKRIGRQGIGGGSWGPKGGPRSRVIRRRPSVPAGQRRRPQVAPRSSGGGATPAVPPTNHVVRPYLTDTSGATAGLSRGVISAGCESADAENVTLCRPWSWRWDRWRRCRESLKRSASRSPGSCSATSPIGRSSWPARWTSILNGKHLGLENLYRMVQYEPTRGRRDRRELPRAPDRGRLVSARRRCRCRSPSRASCPASSRSAIFEHLDREQVAHIPFVNNTVIVFVLDLPQMTVSITIEQLVRWGLDVDDIDTIARENLARYAPDLEIQLVDSVRRRPGRDRRPRRTATTPPACCSTSLHDRLAPQAARATSTSPTPARDMFLAISCDPIRFRRPHPQTGRARLPPAAVPDHERLLRRDARRRGRDESARRA